MPLDDTDERILTALKHNARAPIRELAQSLEIPETTVRDRLRRLEDQGIIFGYRARLELKKVGIRETAWFLVSVPEDARAEIIRKLRGHPQVLSVHPTALQSHRIYLHVTHTGKRGLLDFVRKMEARYDLHVKTILPVAWTLHPNYNTPIPLDEED